MPLAYQQRPAWKTGTIVATGLLLLWVASGVTLSLTWGRRVPNAVVALWPFSVEAREVAAAQAMEAQSLGHSAALANAVLALDPSSVIAARVAGMAAIQLGRKERGIRLLRYAQSLSRRDLFTQLALSEIAVDKGDIEGALRHYDIALRTSDLADRILMPILVPASREPAIAAPLGRMLEQRPAWRLRFVYSLLTADPYGDSVPALIRAARLDLDDPLERGFASKAVEGLIDRGRAPEAFALFNAMAKVRGSGHQVRNGNFTADDRVPPIDWALTDEPTLGAVKEAVDGTPSRKVLSLIATAGRGGPVARQLLMLPPGQHMLGFTAGSVPDNDAGQPTVTIVCAREGGAALLAVRAPTAPVRGVTVRRQFAVPADCDTQWLSIAIGSSMDDPSPVSPWITDIAVDKAVQTP